MNDDRSLERAARSWLEDGPTQAPDRAVEAALLRIASTSQERDLRISWRLPKMNIPARVATAAVIGVLAVGGAFFAFSRPGQPAAGGPAFSPTATTPAPSTTSPSAAPTASGTTTPTPSDYSYLPGSILLEHFGNALDGSEKLGDGDGNKRRLYLIGTNGSGLREFLPGQPASGKQTPDISPDGTKVVFADYADSPKVYEAKLDGSGFHQISPACECAYDQPAYSPDGTKVAVLRVDPGSIGVVGIIDLGDGTVRLLESTRNAKVPEHLPEHPTWSNDGTRILFTRPTGEADKVIETRNFIVNVATGIVTELPFDPALRLGDADWSPDGALIVFTSGPLVWTTGEKGAVHDIYTARPDGTGLTKLTGERGSGGSSWTPDGKHILFYRQSGMWLMDPDGGNAAPVSRDIPDLSSPATGFSYYGDWVPAQ